MKVNVFCPKCGQRDWRVRSSEEMGCTSGKNYAVCQSCNSKLTLIWSIDSFEIATYNPIDALEWNKMAKETKERLRPAQGSLLDNQ